MDLTGLTNFLDQLDRPRVFWWRDDDTGHNAEELRRLLAFRDTVDVPLVVSAVPAWLSRECVLALNANPQSFVAQHGWDHSDNARYGEKSVELGGELTPNIVIDKIRQGQACLQKCEITQLLGLLVPPWNRINRHVVASLGELGFESISTFAKDYRGQEFGLRHINCHIDPIVWRENKRPMTLDELISQTRRSFLNWPDKPIGLLSHHLEMAESDYDTLGAFLNVMSRHPLIECRSPQKLFGFVQ